MTCPGDPPYGVSKAGAIYITKQIAVDYAKDLIVCNCISPGKIVTGAPGLAQDPTASRTRGGARPGRGLAGLRTSPMPRSFSQVTGQPSLPDQISIVDGGWLAG